MGRIIWGHYGLCAVIGMLISASLLLALKLVFTFYKQKRIGFRLLQVGLAITLLGILIWCACQKYLFITSVFPVLAMWLGGVTLAFSIVLLLPALLLAYPGKKDKIK